MNPGHDRADLEPLLPQVELVPVAFGETPLPRIWGPWATLGWTLLCVVVMIAVQTVVLVVFAVVMVARNPNAPLQSLATNGNLIATATWTGLPILVGLVFVLIRLCKCPVGDYLAWRLPTLGQALVAVAGLALLVLATDLTTSMLGRDIVPEVMIAVYKTSWPPLLLLTLIVAAPLGEETLMRGFLYKGIASSRWGPVSAIVISAIAWAMLHVQYDLYGIGTIVAGGFYLGFIRYKYDSLPLVMLLHGLSNVIATTELLIKVHLLH